MANESRRVAGRAHTETEKREVLDRIFAAWTSPGGEHLRLGQLIVNAVGAEPFFTEDQQLVEAVEDLVFRR